MENSPMKVLMLSISVLTVTAEKHCANFVFPTAQNDGVLTVKQDDNLTLPFSLQTNGCDAVGPFKITVSKKDRDTNVFVDFCDVGVHDSGSCATGLHNGCSCLEGQGKYQISKIVDRSDETVWVWLTSNGIAAETYLNFSVLCPPEFDKESVNEVSVAPNNTNSAADVKFKVRTHTKTITKCKLTSFAMRGKKSKMASNPETKDSSQNAKDCKRVVCDANGEHIPSKTKELERDDTIASSDDDVSEPTLVTDTEESDDQTTSTAVAYRRHPHPVPRGELPPVPRLFMMDAEGAAGRDSTVSGGAHLYQDIDEIKLDEGAGPDGYLQPVIPRSRKGDNRPGSYEHPAMPDYESTSTAYEQLRHVYDGFGQWRRRISKILSRD
ncbi:hypothetical protein BaRGS_00018469 [Batillaria attramentaria]|uniref:Uncharacterized protein n=1 Tax=Batillaria attramentaria TaxID=370345 RepID=A0ABD0KTN7_9CAEN